MPVAGGRRPFIAGLAGAALCGSYPAAAASRTAAPSAAVPAAAAGNLREIAHGRGLRFGSEILATELDDGAYRSLFAAECGVLTPGWEAKWDHSEPSPGRFDFGRLDRILDFAAAHHIAVRMHTLLWGLAMPAWLSDQLRFGSAREARTALERHVTTVVEHARGRVLCWDVANEVSDPVWHCGPEGLTMSPWRRALGPDCVPLAFALAREADPSARLFLNEDGLEWQGARFDEKRATYLRLIEGWKSAGVPIDGFGLETHLSSEFPLDLTAYARFLRELAAFGLEIHLTEIDVRDRDMPSDEGVRDRLGASLVRRVLDVALDQPAVTTVVTWGLSDRYTYQTRDLQFARPDGLAPRALPYDASLRPTPIRDAIAAALAAAPIRPRAPAARTAARTAAL